MQLRLQRSNNFHFWQNSEPVAAKCDEEFVHSSVCNNIQSIGDNQDNLRNQVRLNNHKSHFGLNVYTCRLFDLIQGNALHVFLLVQ